MLCEYFFCFIRSGLSRNVVPMPSKAVIGQDHSRCMPSNLYRHPNLTYSFNYYGLNRSPLSKHPININVEGYRVRHSKTPPAGPKKLSTTMHTFHYISPLFSAMHA